MKIVLIDDSATNNLVLRKLSERISGAECFAFTDAELALEYLFANDAALVIIDYSMPKITGIELAKRLRASPRHGTTPLVMVTATAELAVRRRAAEVGVSEFLVKPIRAAEYVSRLEALLATGKGGLEVPA